MENDLFERGCDWELVWKVERDIYFLYHELPEFAGITGDLACRLIYHQPYWDCLDLPLPQMRDEERAFIQNGCLMMILAMAWSMIDASGNYLQEKLVSCREIIGRLEPQDPQTAQLARTVLLALDTAKTKSRQSKELEDLSIWANETFIQGYFSSKLDEAKAAHQRAAIIKSSPDWTGDK